MFLSTDCGQANYEATIIQLFILTLYVLVRFEIRFLLKKSYINCFVSDK